jgi:hypothetical protein
MVLTWASTAVRAFTTRAASGAQHAQGLNEPVAGVRDRSAAVGQNDVGCL